ncbi:MAG: type II toxin-antitoxin system VapC family toxin [Phycisphaerae bacterium]
MNLVDSSAWLEYFADTPNAEHFAKTIEDSANLVVPSIVLFEVFKRILQQEGQDAAMRAVNSMHEGQVVYLDESLALSAARLGVQFKLPMADSIILATAQQFEATIWTQDEDFEGIPGVKYFPKKM